MITLKMADQGRSNFCAVFVVFTMDLKTNVDKFAISTHATLKYVCRH